MTAKNSKTCRSTTSLAWMVTREDKTLGDVVRHVQVSYAGKAAEELFFGGGNRETWMHDISIAALCLRRICGEDEVEEERFAAWLERRTATLVERQRDVIERVARTLLDAKTLHASRVTAAIERAKAVRRG